MSVTFKPVISGLLHFRIVWNETRLMNSTIFVAETIVNIKMYCSLHESTRKHLESK